SCRPKLTWNPYITIEFESKFYQMFREELESGPRQFSYYLRNNPTGRLVVVIDHYKPDNVLLPVADKWAGKTGFLQRLVQKWKLPPVVPDHIVQGGEKDSFDLKISSCRAKSDWDIHVIIEFQERHYQLIKQERGARNRPYVYYLRTRAETRPGV